jgi:hypothetical protein
VRVAGELNRGNAGKPDLAQGAHDVRPVEGAVADLEMLVDAIPGVVEVDGAQRISVFADRFAGGDRLGARDVADVEGEALVGTGHYVAQALPVAERIDEVARLRLERDLNT